MLVQEEKAQSLEVRGVRGLGYNLLVGGAKDPEGGGGRRREERGKCDGVWKELECPVHQVLWVEEERRGEGCWRRWKKEYLLRRCCEKWVF